MRFYFLQQKMAFEVRIGDCSSDVCSSDLHGGWRGQPVGWAPAIKPRSTCTMWSSRYCASSPISQEKAPLFMCGKENSGFASCASRVHDPYAIMSGSGPACRWILEGPAGSSWRFPVKPESLTSQYGGRGT